MTEDFKERFLAWKRDEITIEFFKLLSLKKELLKDSWAAQVFVDSETNARALGAVDMINQIEEIDNESFE